MSPTKSLTWIHLSDLHFGHGREAAPRFDQKIVTAGIIRDVELMAEELGPPDLIFLTGDIAFSASADKEYPAASEWLGELLAALKIEPERLFLVPGNHDIDRKKALEGASRLAHRALRANSDEVNELLEKPSEMEVIWQKLAAYQTFATGFGSPAISPAKPFWTKRLSSALGPIEVIGLNTALLSFDNTDSPQTLALGIGQLQRALLEPKRDALLLVLQHHPPEWLRDGKELRAMLKDWPHILLCGHVHKQQGFVTLPLASRGNIELVAGAGHQDAGEVGEHAYAWGRLSSECLEYYPRAWLKDEMCFMHQRIRPPDDQKGQSPKLGEFARFPRTKLPTALVTWLDIGVARPPSAPPVDPIPALDVTHTPIPKPEPEPTSVGDVVVATFDPANAYFSVPYKAKREQVIGRADALLKVREQLEKGRPTAIGQTAAFVGLGGLGKTQLAVEYAHAYRDKYPGGVYWFNADEDLDAQLTRLTIAARWVSPASEPRFMLEIARHQIQHRSSCLLVFDNVEDRAAIEPLLPDPSATPHLLITSRVSQVGFDPVPIDRLPDEQSLELLRSESGRSLEELDDREAALRIAKQLEGLPLALELAGAFLRRSQGVSWASYAELLERKGVNARGLGDGPLASFTKHNPNLYATLRIDESLFEASPSLREALDLLAWSGSASMGRKLLAVLLDGGDSPALDVALGEAETLRIIKQEQGSTEPENPRFHMHRLVREVRQAEVLLEREPARWLAVLERLGNWFEERRENFSDLRSYEAELDHLEAWQGHAARMGHVREAARLLWLRAYPHYHRGQYRRAHDMVQSALSLFEEASVIDLKLKAHLLHDLGSTLHELGELQGALVHHQKALDIRRNIFGEKHPDTITSLTGVGSRLSDLGKHREALGHEQKALEISRGLLGEKHRYTARCLNNIGTTLEYFGENRNAIDYYKTAFNISREILGEKHPDTAACLNNVGQALSALGKHREALGYQQKALSIRREILGEKHPSTATCLNNVGSTLGELGEHRNALDYKKKALDISREIFGEKHPSTATYIHNLGISLEDLGDTNNALKTIKMSLSVRLEVLGDRHSDTINTWESIVRILLNHHKKAEALATIESALEQFPNNTALKRLKNKILGKRSAPAATVASRSSKKTKPKRR